MLKCPVCGFGFHGWLDALRHHLLLSHDRFAFEFGVREARRADRCDTRALIASSAAGYGHGAAAGHRDRARNGAHAGLRRRCPARLLAYPLLTLRGRRRH
jgi:hypothetical protein